MHIKSKLLYLYKSTETFCAKKSLTIPKGLSESVNRRRTDNAMAKRKSTNNDLQKTTQKTKDRATRTPLKTWSDAPEW
jgi:hypothetical protein